MLGVTRLLCGTATPGDALRYGRDSRRLPAHLLHYSADKRPVVVWNIVRRCNLRCRHCYTASENREYAGELTTAEALRVIDDLAAFGVPTILFSGGEPLLRPALFELASHAVARGVRAVLSTNGTLITLLVARQIKQAGFAYVGVSIDGSERVHDRFRGHKGAFAASLHGIRACLEAGVRVGLRFTLSKYNRDELPAVLRLLEEEAIPRCCVYHLAYAGRGSEMMEADLSHEETRQAVDAIFDAALDFHRRGLEKDVLTVDNHADGPYLYLRVLREQPERAAEVYRMLEWNGGNSSGIAIACIDNRGDVHADQFWQHYSFGNVRERPFSEIWTDTSDPLMAALKERKALLKGRCAACRFLSLCNGNLRERAEARYGDLWMPDPACYLTDEEIGLASQ